MKKLFFLLIIILPFFSQGQKIDYIDNNEKPKLVVGIVVDQMRYDFLTRFYHRFGEGGFKRLVNDGFNCRNNHYNYIPTKTAPGHASIFTGTTPKSHGIIGNDWYQRELSRNVYCVKDTTVMGVGTDGAAGKMSPHRMLVTTFADENRLFNQKRAKTISISIKDRGAVLPGGHTANAAYWFDIFGDGNWISSSYYMKSLPEWVQSFNSSGTTEKYFKIWDSYYPIETYEESGSDLSDFEGGFKDKEGNDFPYDLEKLKINNNNYKMIIESPYGNSLTTDFAMAAINGENLGDDKITDVLTVSYSSTDYVGHNFGPNSKEIEDTYIRIDKDLERLLNFLDKAVGEGDYTLFLTSDHGAVENPGYLTSQGVPSGYFDVSKMRAQLNTDLQSKFKVSDLILSTINNQIYLDHTKIISADLNIESIMDDLLLRLSEYKAIDKVYKSKEVAKMAYVGSLQSLLDKGYNQKRSGDIMFQYNPSYLIDVPWNRTGTDHGTGLNYDTHVPLLFYGKGIKKGHTLKRTEITDIAPTISALLNINFPNASIGNPLEFIFE